MLARQDQRLSSISSTWEPYSVSFRPCWCHPCVLTGMTLVSDERTYIPNSVLCPIQVPMEHLRTVFPTRDQQAGVRTSCAQEVPRDLQYFPMVSAICVAQDAPIHLDTRARECKLSHRNCDFLSQRFERFASSKEFLFGPPRTLGFVIDTVNHIWHFFDSLDRLLSHIFGTNLGVRANPANLIPAMIQRLPAVGLTLVRAERHHTTC